MCIENFVYGTALISAGYIDTESPSPIINLLSIGRAKRGRAVSRRRFVQQKIGNAVVRNRMRRLVKEIVRHHQHQIIEHIDLIFIVRKGALDKSYQELEKSVLHVLRKSSLLKAKRG